MHTYLCICLIIKYDLVEHQDQVSTSFHDESDLRNKLAKYSSMESDHLFLSYLHVCVSTQLHFYAYGDGSKSL